MIVKIVTLSIGYKTSIIAWCSSYHVRLFSTQNNWIPPQTMKPHLLGKFYNKNCMLCSENYSFSRSIEKLHINTHMLCVIIYLLLHISIVANNIAWIVAILNFFELCKNFNYWSYTYILPASVLLGLKNPGFESQIDWQTVEREAFECSRWNVALMKKAGSELACLQFFSILFILRFNIYNHVILETNVLSVSWLNL